jgi:phosphoglycolate phosphatase
VKRGSRGTPAPRALVFDLDGTLIDSRPDLTKAIVRLRAELGLGSVDEATVGSWIGEGARRLVEKALAGSGQDAGAALPRFLEIYEGICTEATFAYPGIDELLGAVRGRLPLALLTNKPERMTRKIVEHLGWSRYFEPLIGGDTLTSRKPDPQGLLAIADRLKLPVDALLMVGDSGIDAATAGAAGAPFLWAEWGYAGELERDTLRAGRSVRTPRDVLPALRSTGA